MTFDVEAGGRLHTVTIESDDASSDAPGPVRVTVRMTSSHSTERDSPTAVVVHARRTSLGVSLVFEDTRHVVDAAITARPGGERLVQLPHVDVPIVIDGQRRRGLGREPVGTGGQRITAPMPGRVLRVLVAAGSDVAAGESLLVIEAMKMENELKAQRAGRVRDVCVAEGTSVESGRLLIVVE